MKFNISKHYHHFIALLVFFISLLFFFYPQLQGKKLNSNDFSQWKAMAHEILEYKDQTGDVALWTGSMFSGMPTYQIHTPQNGNLLRHIERIFSFGISFPFGYALLGMISMYLLFQVIGINKWLSIVGALFFVFSTTYLILLEAGHNTKFNTIMISPILISGVLMLFRKKWILGLVLYSFGFGLNLYHNHIQMTYYLGMVIGIFLLLKLIDSFKEKSLREYAKILGFLLLGSILGIGSTASKLATTYEYSSHTMRGDPILASTQNETQSSSNVKGLDWTYAMNWSNGWDDLLASFQPLAVGGGSIEMVDKNTALAKAVGSRTDTQAPLYHGGLPSTSGPIYFGVVVFLFFLFGVFLVKGTVKWWIVIGVVLTMLISLGNNFEIFNRFIFDYFPLYNKFRTPNSILNVTAIFIPILAILGIQELIKSKNKSELIKPLIQVCGVFLGFHLLMLIAGGLFVDFSHPNDARYEQIIDPIISTRKELFYSFTLRGLFLILTSFAIVYFYLKQKISTVVMVLLIGVIGSFDLISVGKRYLSSDDFQTKRNNEAAYLPRPVDNQILSDPDIHYRVFDISTDPFNNAFPSYHHKTIGGYHPAKLQRYQDIIERHISKNNAQVLNMLNTKYFIMGNAGGEVQAQRNPDNLGNAWMVPQIRFVATANEEIDGLDLIDPATTAIVHQEFNDYTERSEFVPNGSITLDRYSPNELEYSFNSNDDQFVVFSEVWYQPGWNAYIDGQEVDHIRVNYILRGLKVPSGNHQIVFRFEPRSYYLGEWISLMSSLLILMLGLFFIWKEYFKK